MIADCRIADECDAHRTTFPLNRQTIETADNIFHVVITRFLPFLH